MSRPRLDPHKTRKRPYCYRGQAYRRKEDFDKAIADLSRAIDLDPKEAAAYRHRGAAYYAKKEFGKAIADVSRSIRLDPKASSSYRLRGAAYYKQRDWDAAIADHTKAIELDPKAAYSYELRAYAYYGKEDWDAAIADHTKAIQIDPKDVSSYRWRAEAYLRKGDLESALEDYSRAIQLDPKDTSVLNGRGWVYMRKKDYTKALADIGSAIEIKPSATCYGNRAWALFHIGDLNGAERDYRIAMRLDAEYWWSHAVLFRIEVARGRKPEAVKELRQRLRNLPMDAAATTRMLFRYYLGEATLEDLRDDFSWSEFEVAVRGYQPSAAAETSLARIRNFHVLVIGIGSYKDANIPKLNYTIPDAAAVYEFFKSSPNSPARPSNVHLLRDEPNEDGLVADRRGIMVAINRYLVRRAVHKGDLALLYFAGHGDMGKHPTKGTEYYLIPQDASMSDLFVTGIELGEFQRLWSAIPAKTKILIADACNSGGFSGIRAIGGATGMEQIAGQAKAVFSACKSDQKSMECHQLGHGLFTHVLLEGLKGKADTAIGDGDGRVTLLELKRWLDRQVPTEARRYGGNQTPITSLVDAWGNVYLTR